MLADSELYIGGTFAWHPAACAGALKSIEVMERDRVLDHASDLERFALERLGSLVSRYQIVGDVRIKGLYIALEFVKDKISKEPMIGHKASVDDLETMRKVGAFLRENGLFTFIKANLIFIVPPLCINESQLNEGLGIVDRALAITDSKTQTKG